MVSMDRVYRIEVPIVFGISKKLSTYGPFCAGIYDKQYQQVCDVYRSKLRGIPKEPEEEGLKFWSGMVCGAFDYSSLRRWITCGWAFNDLIKAGFKLNMYDVPSDKVQHSKTQSVWHPDDAILVGETTLEQMRDERRKKLGIFKNKTLQTV